jgi:alpha-D-ribose 1-methylphosphonate 5-triphosphate synthase subunit PhnH
VTSDNDLQHLAPGFSAPVVESQQNFRIILNAMAHPGKIFPVVSSLKVPPPLNAVSAVICLTLLDFDTTLWADVHREQRVLRWFKFHCGCPITTEPYVADFALITDPTRMPLLNHFRIGEEESPEHSATLIIQAKGLTSIGGKRFIGPGIETYATLNVQGIPEEFWKQRHELSSLYPLGIDIIFTCDALVAALPRTAKMDV